MNVVILQPSYIPWRGYFHQIQKADIFVFYDCVQYDKHSWRNRNKIKTLQGGKWLTIPVKAKSSGCAGRSIRDVPIIWDIPWFEKHKKSLIQNYAKAPFFNNYKNLLQEMFCRRDEKLADFTCATTEMIARKMGILKTKFMRSSELEPEGVKSDRLLNILKKLNATHYISGPSARSYIELDKFSDVGITVEFIEYNYPKYPQINGAFIADVTILDLLFNIGPEAPRFIWGK